jgi:hypothetical protein
MNIVVSEKKIGTGGEKLIGIGHGPLIAVNPSLQEKKELYGWQDKEDEKELSYTGTDRNGNDWGRLCFIFKDLTLQKYVECSIFISKELAQFEKDGITKKWYVNQFGKMQLTDDEKNLFRSFTILQKKNKETKEWEDMLNENGSPIELSYRQAYRGETALYSMLRHLVTQDWFSAMIDNTLFIPVPNPAYDITKSGQPDYKVKKNIPVKDASIDKVLNAAVKEIRSFIGTDTFQDVMFMVYVEAKDTDNGVQYSNNCVEQAWVRVNNNQCQGWKDAAINCSSNSWGNYETKPKGEGAWKKMDMYEFVQAVRRNKHMWEFAPLHVFSPESFVQAGSQTFVPASESEKPSDISY